MNEVGGWQIDGELGRGGMGVVYAARRGEQRVALKVLTEAGALDPEAKARFVLEARALARLDHPNLVRFVDAGLAEGVPFVVLDHVAGRTLGDRLREGPLTPSQAARLVADLAGAVHHAHQRSILHRDLKPGNVIVRPDGAPTIIDFGLAKLVETARGERLSRTGDILGTPAYMAPEQALGRVHEVGPWTDVYGLGALLYACLTGGPPVSARSVLEALDAVVTKAPVAPSRLVRGLDPALEAICLNCLAKSPAERYPSAASLQAALTEWLHAPRRGAPGPARGPGALLVGGGLLGALLVVVALVPRSGGGDATPVGPSASTPEPAPLAGSGGASPAVVTSVAPAGRGARERADGLVELALLRAQASPEDGLSTALQAVEADPEHAGAWALVGRLRHASGDLQGALAACSRAIALDPTEHAGWMNRGALRFELEQLREAEEDLTHAIELDPTDPNGWFNRAVVRARLEDPRGALRDLDALLERFPHHTDARSQRGRMRANARDWRGAEEDLAQVVSAPGDHVEDARSLALIRLDYLLDGFGAAQAASAGLERRPDDVDLLILRALGAPARAEQDASLALQLSPGNAMASSARALGRLQRGALAEALQDAEAEVAGGEQRRGPQVHLTRARVRAALGDEAGAREDVERVLAGAEPAPRLRFEAARLLLALRSPEEARQVLQPLLADPRSPGPALALQAEVLLALGRPTEEAASAWERAAARSVDPIQGRLWLEKAKELRAARPPR